MSDSDQDQKNTGVPSWQLKQTDLKDRNQEAATTGEPASRQTLVELAKTFLDEHELRNASTDKKIEFLESKGLRSDEIQELLGVSRNASATNTSQIITSSQKSLIAEPSPEQQAVTPQSTRETPPIITYPEFLTTPLQPAPLVTKSRVLTSLYLFSGLSALLYGTNTYLVTPMIESLTISRLSLAETASSNLLKLISKLESSVSVLPSSSASTHSAGDAEKTGVEQEEESDGDPTEMFHRDIGVQTSLPATPSFSRPMSLSPSTSALSDHITSIASLSTGLQSLVEESSSEGNESSDVLSTIAVLRNYLDELAFVAPTYASGANLYGVIAAGGSGGDTDDEISRVKASIRGVKGVLLSARSFPGGATRAR